MRYDLKNSSQYLILLFLLVIFSCNTDKVQDNDTISYSVQPDKASQQSLPSLVKDVKYVKLHLPDEEYLQEIKKVLVKDSSFYLFESSHTGKDPKIYSFDHSGSFNYVIDKPGRGPGEFEYVHDFDITGEFIVLSTQTELKFYDRRSGQYVRSIDKPDLNIQNFAMLDGNTLVATPANRTRHNRSKNQLKIYDLKRKEKIFEGIPFKNHTLSAGISYRHFFNLGDSTSVIPKYEQTVYRVLKENNQYSLKPAYRLDFGKYWINKELLAESYNNRGSFFDSVGDYVYMVDIFETSEIIYTHYNLQGNNQTFIYDKKSEETLNIAGFTDNNIGWTGKPETVHENWIINLVTPFEIENGIQPNEQLKEFPDNSVEKGYPFLIFAQF